MNELLVFDVHGYVAHFRRVDSTTTALTYGFPPRTTIIGMIAAMLGMPRDSYYDEFAPEKCRIAVSVMSRNRRIFLKQKYINTKYLNELQLRGVGKFRPTALQNIQLLVPDKFDNPLHFRIFFFHKDRELMDELERRIRRRRFRCPISLGPAYCLASASFVDSPSFESLEMNEAAHINTVIPVTKIAGREWAGKNRDVRIYREGPMPVHFARESVKRKTYRRIVGVESYIYTEGGEGIAVKPKGEIFRCDLEGRSFLGIFMAR